MGCRGTGCWGRLRRHCRLRPVRDRRGLALASGTPGPAHRIGSSATGATHDDVDFVWSCYLRRFDLEHTFGLFKQSLGWTRPRLRDPRAADRWTWLVIAAHTQLRLAAPLAIDRRKPWEIPS
ncbi:hypothetical protein GCM10010350_71470 [Streptomyces galilaeus]|nr:hypothetical protein GCM10010350_71470 [Streptomyces galilaeus]